MTGWLSGAVRRYGCSLAVRSGIVLLALLAGNSLTAQSLQPGGPVDFGSIAVGSSSVNLTLTFSANVTTTITAVNVTTDGVTGKDFVLVAQTCTGTLFTNQSCNVTVAFAPLQAGLRKGALSIVDSTGTAVNRLFLHGIGLGPQLVSAPVTGAALSTLGTLSPSTFQTSASVFDGAGNLYFNDYLNGRILEETPSGAVSLVTSLTGTTHSSMALDGAGNLYVSSPSQGKVQAIIPGVSSAPVSTGSVPLVSPAGVAVDAIGNLYIADSQANHIVMVPSSGAAPTILPLSGLGTPLSSPYGLATDNTFLYIADSGNGRIVEVNIASGAATALTVGNALSSPYGLAVDAAGNLIVANAGTGALVQVTSTGTVFNLSPDANQAIASSPLGITLKSSTADLVASDATLGLVAITRSTGSLTFPTPTKVGFPDTADNPETLTVQNSGNQAIQFAASDPAISATPFIGGATNTCPVLTATAAPLAIGATCTYSFGFTPSVVGANTATVTLKGTATGTGAAITGTANLAGAGLTPVDTLKVTATPNFTTPGVPVSFTVTALEGATVVTAFTGTVTFTMTDATGAFLSGASYTFTPADAGVHTFAAPAGAQFNTAGTFTISAHLGTVTGASNTVLVQFASIATLTSSINPVFINVNTTLTATISATGATVPATGSITFYDGAATLGACTLAAGKCSLPISFAVAGTHSLTFYYPGDTNYGFVTSAAYSQVVTDFVALVGIASSINPSFVNQQTTFTATVTAAAGQTGAGTPTGTVTFSEGVTVIGTVTLVNGFASIPDTFTTTGNHLITVAYSGDLFFGPVTPPPYTQTVTDYTTQAVLTSSINPSIVNQSTTLTATIVPTAGQTGAPTPTGTVVFKNGTATLGTVTLVAGVATLPASFAIAGSYPLTAVYSGDANYGALTSTVLTQVVNPNGFTSQVSTLTSSVNPSLVYQQTTLTATVIATPGQIGPPAPTGTITFKDGVATIGTAPLTAGVATLPITFATIGSHPLTAVYGGDTNFAGSTSSVLTQVVNGFATVVTETSTVNPSFVNQQTTLTALLTVVPGQGAIIAPTGTITFKDGATTLGTAPVNAGGATLSASFATAGNHLLTVVYSGDINFATETSANYTQVVNNYTAQAALTSSINPSFVDQQVTLTATVSATPGQTGSVTPTGTVTFKSGTATIGTGTLVNGVATLLETFLTTGSFSLTVVYGGDSNFSGSTSPVITQVVNDYTSQVALTSSINPSGVNQSTTLTATVSATAGQTGSGTPTGTVTFKNGATTLGTATLVNGVATLPTSFAVVGSYPLTVIYGGDANFTGSTSAVLTQVVANTTFTSQVALTSSVNPSLISQNTTLTATVSALTGTGPPTGTVTFKNGVTVIGTGTLAAGVATLITDFTVAGSYPITAVYGGDTNFSGSTSSVLTQVVADYTATATLTSSVNPSLINQQTTLTATIKPSAGLVNAPTPTGTVTFKNGTATLGTATLVNGVATMPTSFATAGSYPLTVVYSGDANYVTATSAALTQQVANFTVQVSLASSINPSFINQQTTLTATVAATPGQTAPPTPTGTVIFKDGTTTLGTGTLSGGVATLLESFTAAGNHQLTVVYSGDSNYPSGTSAILTQVVTDFSTQVAMTSSINPSFVNQLTNLTATVQAVAGQPGSSTPNGGTVIFYNGTTVLGSAPNVNGTATLPISFPTVGSYTLTCLYGGVSNYLTSTCAAITQVVKAYASQSSLTSSINPAFVNQQTTLTATVQPVPGQTGAPAPTGTVSFYDGTTLLGNAAVTNVGGVTTASFVFSYATASSQSITCTYSGDTNYIGSTCGALTQVINDYASQISLTSSINPSFVNQQTTLTATVSAVAGQTGSITPTGTVTFKNGTATLGAVTLVNGVATYPASFALAGSYPLTAIYSGSTTYIGVTSSVLPQVVNLYTDQVMLTSSNNPAYINAQTTLTATVVPTASQASPFNPTGSITFLNGTAPLGTVALTNGLTATLSISFPIVGSYPITAVYSGDANFATATSPSLSQIVSDFTFAVATGTSSTATVLGGYTTGYTFTLTPVVPAGTTSAFAGPIVFSLSGFPPGTTASFSPSTVAAGQTTATITLTVKPPPIVQAHLDPANNPKTKPRATHLAPVVLALLVLPFALTRRRRASSLFLWLLLCVSAIGLTGCVTDASSGYYGANAQTSTLTVTAYSGTLQRSTTVTLIVQ